MTSRTRGTLGLTLAPLLLAAGAAAQANPVYVCSIAQAIECDDQLQCGPPEPARTPPTFLRVDIDRGVITLLAPAERRGETTQIGAAEHLGGQWSLTGIEAERAWNMVIADEDGSMTISITFPRAAWSVFGKCMPADQIEP
jgi:hypothetical protein